MTEDYRQLQERIGYSFRRQPLLRQALSHSSYANEHKKAAGKDNERLEFLGDAVLELVSSDYLYHIYPDMPEGDMTRLRASLVCEPALAFCARQIGLPGFLMLGHGEEQTGGRERNSIVSDALEALIGSIYLDGGLAAARKFILNFVLNDAEHKRLFYDSKTTLQEIIQRDRPGERIAYELTGEEGPDHAKQFAVCVLVGEETLGAGKGSTKKAAEQEAAYHALLKLREKEDDARGNTCI